MQREFLWEEPKGKVSRGEGSSRPVRDNPRTVGAALASGLDLRRAWSGGESFDLPFLGLVADSPPLMADAPLVPRIW